MAGGIAFSGLSSGLDTKAIVDALVGLAKQPATRLQKERSNLNSKKAKMNTIRASLMDLETKGKELDTLREFLAFSASSAATDKLQVSSGGNAQPGVYSVTVQQLAQVERTYSDAFSSNTNTGLFGTGTLTIGVGTDTAINITVDATSTLSTIASAINSTSGLRATASVVQINSTSFRLVVQGSDSGSANSIAFTEGGTLTLNLDVAGNQVQAAADAQIALDGFTVTRSSNIIDDAIQGVTLDLRDDTLDPTVKVTIQYDRTKLKDNIKKFVDAYNSVANKVSAELTFNGTVTDTQLFSDSTMTSLLNRLRSTVSSEITGVTSTTYRSLASAGITLETNGSLKIDDTNLSAALDDNPNAIAQLFIDNTGQSTQGVAKLVQDLSDDYTDVGTGLIPQRTEGFDARVKSIGNELTRVDERVTAYRARLEAQFTSLEVLLAGLSTQNSFIASIGRR